MRLFDPYIEQLKKYIEDMKSMGRSLRQMDCPKEPDKLLEGLSIRVGDQACSDVILRRDTFVELGNPAIGSCSFLVWTNNRSILKNNMIHLIGTDIPESPEKSLPFGQVLMVSGTRLGGQEQERLERSIHISDHIEGYMVKSMPRRTWARVSKDAANRGFCFETLGSALMAIFRSDIPEIDTMEILFVTSSKEDVQQLNGMASEISQISRKIRSKSWKARGYDIECTSSLGCRGCPDRSVIPAKAGIQSRLSSAGLIDSSLPGLRFSPE